MNAGYRPAKEINPMKCTRRSFMLIPAPAALALIGLGPASLRAAQAAAATPSPVATPTTWDEVLQAGLDRGLPSVALRVEQGDQVIFDGAAGYASTENKTPVTTTDQFRIASTTKTFTSVLVLQQVDDGVLTLEDTVSHWLDDPVVAKIPYVDEITVRQLLNHSSGVYDWFDEKSPFWQDAYFGEGADWTKVWTPQELLAYLDGDKQDPYFAPGKGVHYSNAGYFLLGMILEAATGKSYADLLHARITKPLGLTGTIYGATEPMPADVADAYHLIEGALVNVSTINLSAYGAAAAIISTTQDLNRFIDALLGGKLLKPATLDEMLTFGPSDHPGFEAGLGIVRWTTPDGKAIGHSGDGPGCSARMYQLEQSDLTVVLLANIGGNEDPVDATYVDAIQMALTAAAPGS
jgi:D-alanyl-D-alanine carboxypeptidase